MLEELLPVCEVIARLDLCNPEEATRALEAAFPDLSALTSALAAAEGLTPRQAGPDVKFGRLAKPSEATHGLSIDVVEMRGAAAEHTHPNGEVSLVVRLDGEASFFGCSHGWVVVPPGSTHVPTVVGGTMRIAYFLPEGAMIWR